MIVEVQRQADEDKLLSWPVYVSILRAKLACATVLLVIAPDPGVAAWARQPIELGHPGFRLTPVVVEFDDVPWLRDRDAACRLPELAMLSVMAQPRAGDRRGRDQGDLGAAGGSEAAILGRDPDGAAGGDPADLGGTDARL